MLVQVTPAFVVRSIVPKTPTAVPVLESVKETPKRRFVVPLVWLIQPDCPDDLPWNKNTVLNKNKTAAGRGYDRMCLMVALRAIL
jgi:hypothetical protein